MNLVTKAACVVLCVASSVGPVAGQVSPEQRHSTDQQTSTAEQIKPIDGSLQRILSVLDQLIETQKAFEDNDVRTAVRAGIADLLWSYDEPRARKLFEEAFLAMANSPVRERSIWVPPTGPDSHYPVRNVVIPAIVRRDPSLAARLAERLPETPPNMRPESSEAVYGERSLILSQLASYLSSGDPRLVARLARVFAERGEIRHLHSLLSETRMRDPKTANDLFVLALERSRQGQASIDDVRWFATYLFPYFGYSGEEVIHYASRTMKADPYLTIKASPQAITLFLEFAYEVVSQWVISPRTSKAAPSNPQYPIFRPLVRYFERFMPDKADSFRALVEEALTRAPEEERSSVGVSESGTVEELVARADKLTESRQKDALYSRASAQAMMSRNLDQAAAIIERITDERIRANETFNLRIRRYQFLTEDISRALDRDDLEKAKALVATTSDSDLRLQLLDSLVDRLVSKDKVRATRLLTEAEEQVLRLEDRVQRARQLMALAGTAARIDLDRGFDRMKFAVAEFNRAGFVPEWEKHREAQSNTSDGKQTAFTKIGLSWLLNNSVFESLGARDPGRALAVAQEIQIKEASALAQLSVCRAALLTLQAPAAGSPTVR